MQLLRHAPGALVPSVGFALSVVWAAQSTGGGARSPEGSLIPVLRLRDEDGYSGPAFRRVVAALRHEMAKIGFPEISISSRISNMENCHQNYGSPGDFITGVLRQRGLD